mgnify:CR=1 FL=1
MAAMDAAKKAELEKRIIMGLAGVFAVTFFIGPLRSLGLFTRTAPVATGSGTQDKVDLSQSLGTLLRQGPQRVAQQAAQLDASSQATAAPVSAPRYTAQHLRDPLASLLPDGKSPSGSSTAQVAASPGSQAGSASLPPKLEVQGMVWGGAEPQAIIDGRVYGIGDVVGGGRILAIDREGVMIEYQGQTQRYGPASMSAERVASGGR